MTDYTLFGQPASPATLAADATAYTLGVEFACSVAAPLTALWFYSAPGAAALPGTIALYEVTGQVLVHSETPSWSGAAGSGWVRAAFASPPSLTGGTNYRAAVLQASAANWYSSTSNYWSSGSGSAGITNGPLSAPASGSADNGGTGSYAVGATLAYPATGTPDNYWIDVEVTVGTPVTVTATQEGAGHTYNGIMLAVQVLTGAAARALQSGATAAGHGNEITITTTETGSWVFGAIADPTNEAYSSPTAATSQIAQHVDTDAGNDTTYVTFGPVAATGTPGATVYGYSLPSASSNATVAAEILPSGTIALDASTPAAVFSGTDITVTTASFTPPAGLLVALVASSSNDASVTVSITDSLGLTWRQLVFTNGPSYMGAGVWVADVPGAAVSPPGLLMAGIV